MNFVCPFCNEKSPTLCGPHIWFHGSEKCHDAFEAWAGRLDFTEYSFVPSVRAEGKGLAFWNPCCTLLPRWNRVLFGKLLNPIKMEPMWSGLFPIDLSDFTHHEDTWKAFQDWHYTASSCGYPVSFLEFQAYGPIHSVTSPMFAHVITGSAEAAISLSRIGARKTLCNPAGEASCVLREANDDHFVFEGFPYKVFQDTYDPHGNSSQIVKVLLNLVKAERYYQGWSFDYSNFRLFILTEWRFFSTQNMREPYRNVDFGKKCVYSMKSFERTEVFY